MSLKQVVVERWSEQSSSASGGGCGGGCGRHSGPAKTEQVTQCGFGSKLNDAPEDNNPCRMAAWFIAIV